VITETSHFDLSLLKMNSIIPVEQLKDLWRRIADLNARIRDLNLEAQDLKDRFDETIFEKDTSKFVRKVLLFKDGDPKKGMEIKKGDPYVPLDPVTSNLYIGGAHQGSSPSGDHSNVVIKPGSLTKSNRSTILKTGATCSGSGSDGIAIGALATSSGGGGAISIGGSSKASALSSIALGDEASSESANCITIGPTTKASGTSSLAIGYHAEATYSNALAIGNVTKSSVLRAISIGYGAQALHMNTLVIKSQISSTSVNTILIGDSIITRAQFGNLVIDWTATKVTFKNGSNVGTLNLVPPT
jgi:hypothetical protein